VTADEELWFEEEESLEVEPLDVVPFDVVPLEVVPLDVVPLEVEPLDDDESSLLVDELSLLEVVVPEPEESSLDVAFAVVAVSDWPEVVCVESVVAVLPSEPLAAIVPKAIAKVASAAATTRRRILAIRRARARRRSRTRSAFEVGGGVEGMRAS
jgi:hypothetical protein